MFQVLMSPGKVGTDNFVLQLMNGDGSPLGKGSDADAEPARTRHRANGAAGTAWSRRLLACPRRAVAACPAAGGMRIDALVTDFQKVTLEDDFEIRRVKPISARFPLKPRLRLNRNVNIGR